MNWIINLIVFLLIQGIIQCNETRGDENSKAKEVEASSPTIAKQHQAIDILKSDLQNLLDPKLPEVNSQSHDEVKEINSLIASAISKNAYSNSNFRPPDENILKLKARNLLGAAPHSLELSDPHQPPSSHINTVNTDDIAITHNIIESNIISDFLNQQTTNSTIWHPSLIGKTDLNRELLKFNSIKQNFNYNYKNFTDIKLWKIIKIDLTTNLLVGLSHNHANNSNGSQLILITEVGFKFNFVKLIEYPKLIDSLDIVRIVMNNYLITIENVSFINFYKVVVTNETYDVEKINEINLHKQILQLKYFYKHLDKIRMIFVTVYDGKVSADLYEFDIQNSFNFWLIKTIPLTTQCTSVAILDTGRDYILAFPQNDEVVVYQYENETVKQLESIKTDMVTDVSGFSMGGYSYLAVGGHNPQILRYQRGQLHPQSMLSQSFGFVEQWFPISARTHRDDLLLLVQHRITFSTHSLKVLQALIWDGEAFNIVPTTPCYRNGIMSHYGITCMIDIEQETDIAGSVIIQHGKNISILVPRGEEESQLYDLNLELVPVPNPLLQDIDEFNSIYGVLSKLVENFEVSIQQIQNTIDNAINPDEFTVIPANWQIETLEFENTFVDENSQISAVLVDNIPISKMESEFYLPFLEDILDEALKKFDEPNAGVVKRQSENNIQFDFLNGIPANELLFATEEDTIELNGVQEFENFIYVGNDVIMGNDSKVNGISIREDTINSESESVLHTVECDEVEVLENLLVTNEINGREFNQENMGRLLDDGRHNSMIVEEMIIGGDLNFTLINNVDFEHFLNKIIFKNLPTKIEKLNIAGNILAQTEFGLKHLNEIPFPDGFVFRNSTSQQDIIRGHKVFTQALGTNEIDTDGEINGIKPSQVITLGDEQFIPGEVTFSHIEVTESLEVNGTIKGEHLDKFLANPTITQTNIINASCIFNQLEVEGNVYLTEIESINLDRILENIVYDDQPDEFIRIDALKIFDVVYVETDHFEVTSNFLNNKHNLDNYVTKTANQILNMNYINGTVKFGTVTLTGLFNGVNVTELDLNSIKTGGDQYIDKKIKFQHPIRARVLKILENINKKPISQLINIKMGGNIRIDSNFEVEHLEIDHLHTNGNIQSENGEVNGINLNEFNKVRFSLTRPQTITGTFIITSATVGGDLKPNFLNDISMANFTDLITTKKNTISDIFAGKVSIHNIIVKGNVTINYVNGFNMDKIIQNVIWLDRPITISNRLTFLDEVVIHSDLEVLSQVNTKHNLNTILEHLVYRNRPIVISEKKIFTNGIKIYGDYATEYINDESIDNLLLSSHLNHVKNKIIINGNLQVNNLNAPFINDLALTELTSLYHFDEATKTHYLNIDNVNFANPQTASLLYVNGSINDIFNADEFLQNVVQTNKPIHFDGNLKLFQKDLLFTRNVVVSRLNSIDLDNYFEHLVHIDEKDPINLNANIEFHDEIAMNQMQIGGDLITNTIMQYDPNQWLRNNLFINENVHVRIPLKFERGTFHATAMGVNFLNGVNMSKVLTYNTEQVFDDDLIVSEIETMVPVRVGGLVNQLKLPDEKNNTFMITGNTTIKIPLHIKNLNVHKTVKTPRLINGKSLTELYTIEPQMSVPDSISFHEIRTQTIIDNHHDISGIDFQRWYTESLWKQGRETQTVKSKYTIANLAVGEGGIHGTGLVNNKSMNEIIEMRNRDQLKLENEVLAYHKEIELICMDLRDLIYLSQRQIYYVKYFDDRIILDNGNSKIITKLFFVFNHGTYLLISSSDCHTKIYRWDAENIDFVEILKFQTGYVNEWHQIHGKSANETILVSHSISNGFECVKMGVNMWRFNGYSISESSAVLIHPRYDIKSLWTSDKFLNVLFLITEGINREPNVFQINEYGKIENQWKVPINHRQLQFLPIELISNLALGDGSQIFLIDDYKIPTNRVKRHNLDKLKNLFKPWNDKLLGSPNNGILKIGLKNDKSFRRRLFDLDDKESLVEATPVAQVITSDATVSATETTTGASIVGDPLKSEIPDTVEQIIDNIFDKIVKISDKSVKNDQNPPEVSSTKENVATNISKNIVSTTLNSLAKIEDTKLQVAKDSEAVGDPLGIPKDNLTKTIDVGYPHVKNITKSFGLTAADALLSVQKLSKLASNQNSSDIDILSSETATTISDGYKIIEQVTKTVIDTTINTVSQADVLSNKFELNNDKHASPVSNIVERETTTPTNVTTTTQNNSTVGAGLDSAYAEIEKFGKKLVDRTIKNIANIEDFKDRLNMGNAHKVGSAPRDESVVAPNPSESTRTPENLSEAIKPVPPTTPTSVNTTKQNNSTVGVGLDSAYAEIEKFGKKLVDRTIKNIANIEDFKDRLKHRKNMGNAHKVGSAPDEFVIASNPSETTRTPEILSEAIKPAHYNLGASLFNTFRRIGDKQSKTRPRLLDSTEEIDDNFDRTIGQEINYNGVIASENSHIPEKGTGEIVVLHVGGIENRRMLTAVSIKTDASTIPGKHDTIKIYDDIMEGRIYQEIHASKPTGLTAIHIGDQTMLAFLEDKVVIQLFIYHGIEGFKNFNEYKLPMVATHLSSVTLSRYGLYACPRNFLVVTFPNKLWFLEAIMAGNCGVDANLDCTLAANSVNNG